MIPTEPRGKTLIESGLSHTQARKLTLEFSDRGIGVECRPSRNIGWDVWVAEPKTKPGAVWGTAAAD
jgi:hypothetical protein